tara:strand:+ start:133 stop:567 length:435 start_codon:yes stop_codon:yes gene_type:complete
MSRASDLANLIASGSTTIHGEAGVTSSGSTGKTTNLQNGLAKVLFSMNLDSSTFMTVANNSISSQTLNISSGTDAGTGLARGNLTNAMSALDYIWTEGAMAANNTANLDVGVATTSLIPFQQHDADSSSDVDDISCATIFGDLV